MIRTLLAGLAAALVTAGGAGCSLTHSLWKDTHLIYMNEDEKGQQPFLGIVVKKDAPGAAAKPRGTGVRVERLYRSSPAENAGVRAGDAIVRFGAQAVNSAADIEGAMKAGPVKPTSHVELTLVRDGQQIVIPVDLQYRSNYGSVVKERLEAHARAEESSLEIPFIVNYHRMEIDPEAWLAYQGERVKEPVVLYRDVDVVPVLGIISIFRLEQIPAIERWRLHLVTWPLVFTGSGNAESYMKRVREPGEDAYQTY
ncbi:MAG TPA: PDZ domain-containing protein [Planctomycetota bacterium]|nr:PDZ domain-containing protein [Planctomycetota bacterium]